MNIGFIGTGVMGSRMVKRMLQAGFQVTVYNRSPEKVKPLIDLGANRAETIPSLSSQCEVICTCLSMPADVLEVYLGENGIIHHAKPGMICADFTTVGPDTSKTVFAVAKEKGITYLDAPVSGGPEGIEQGTLTIMVGGEQKGYDVILPMIKSFGKTIEFLGPSGSGSIAKLINQYLVAVHSLAASEAMVTGAAYGLDSEKLYQILKQSYGQSRILERHMEQYVFPRQFEPGGAVKYVHKDVNLANQLMQEIGMNKFTGQLAEEAFAGAIGHGLADNDMSAVIQPLEKDCGVIIKKSMN